MQRCVEASSARAFIRCAIRVCAKWLVACKLFILLLLLLLLQAALALVRARLQRRQGRGQAAKRLKAAKVRKGGKGLREGAGVALGWARHSHKAPVVCPAPPPCAAAIQDYEVTPLTFKNFRFDAKLPQAMRITSLDATRCGLFSVPVQHRDTLSISTQCDALAFDATWFLRNRKGGTSEAALHSRDDALMEVGNHNCSSWHLCALQLMTFLCLLLTDHSARQWWYATQSQREVNEHNNTATELLAGLAAPGAAGGEG